MTATEDDEVARRLIQATPGANYVRIWGVIDRDRWEAEVRATCRRCGRFGTFKTPQEAGEFKREHLGANNHCPYEKDVIY